MGLRDNDPRRVRDRERDGRDCRSGDTSYPLARRPGSEDFTRFSWRRRPSSRFVTDPLRLDDLGDGRPSSLLTRVQSLLVVWARRLWSPKGTR